MSDTPQSAQHRILVVDDNPTIHEDFRLVLGPGPDVDKLAEQEAALFGEKVIEAEQRVYALDCVLHGQDALQQVKAAKLEDRPYALAFVDMRMPAGWDGLETIERLWREDPRMEIVICTAYSDHSWKKIVGVLGHTDRLLILKKPFEQDEVRQLAHALTTKWALSRAAENQTRDLQRQVEARSAEFRLAKEVAEKATAAKSEFLASMSYEMRTPLESIAGVVELLAGTSLDAAQRQYLEIARQSSSALRAVINDVLDYSKIEIGKMEIASKPFVLGELLENVLDDFAARAAQKGLELGLVIESNVNEEVIGDANHLRQILGNLIDNALKFTEHGRVTVELGNRQTDGEKRSAPIFRVRDTGPGIEHQSISRLFDSFSQLDGSPTRKFGGTGLGLALCKRLVGLLGGTIGVESVRGRGSTFWFSIPMKIQRGETGQEKAPARRFEEIPPMRILAIGAENDVAALQTQLESWQHSVQVIEAVDMAVPRLTDAQESGTPFDAAICCVKLQASAVEELAARIRAVPAIHSTALILVAELAGLSQAIDQNGLGFAAIVAKPLKPSRLGEALRQASGILPPGLRTPNVSSVIEEDEWAPPGARILVAEDNEVNALVIRRLLVSRHYECDLVNDGRAAAEMARKRAYDLIVMDCIMPEMDGYEATRRIRQIEAAEPNRRRIPILALTAQTPKQAKDAAAAAGMDHFICKPVNPRTLMKKIRQMVVPAQSSLAAPVGSCVSGGLVVIDDAGLLDRSFGDVDFAKEVLSAFKSLAERDWEALQTAVQEAKAEESARLAHGLKGVAAHLGASCLETEAAKLESLANAADMENAEKCLADLHLQLQFCLQYIPIATARLKARARAA
jgi:two-component system, sensor histidine kinase and response regulator